MSIMELEHVSFVYPDGTPALRNISLRLESGSCYCLQGPNGCGKSTLFRILTGLSFADSGEYRFDGMPVTAGTLADRRRAGEFHRRVGFVFQNTELQLFCRSVEDEVAFGLRQMELPEEEIERRTEEYLRMTGLLELRRRAPFALSGGEKKRCALAAVLAMEPSVLILDEPISGLDEDGQRWVLDFAEGLKGPDRLLLVATHHQETAGRLADVRLLMTKDHTLTCSAV